MTDQHPLDERGLELATSQQLPASNGIDPVIKAARKDWLAIGAAAEKLGRTGLNEQDLLASLQSELLVTPPPVEEPKTNSFDWSWIAVGLAASVLIAATIIGAMSQRQEPIPGLAIPSQLAKPDLPAPDAPQLVQSTEPEAKSSVGTTTTDSDLDEAINTMYTALQSLANEQRGVDRTLTDFDTQLKQLSAEIAGESL
jgi:hypothetical protein